MRKRLAISSPIPMHAVQALASMGILLLSSAVTARTPSTSDEQASPEIIGDRPDYTESAATVLPLHFQGELGATYSTVGPGNRFTIPELLLRFGAIEHLEVRLGVPSYEACFVDHGLDWEFSAVEIGVKAAFDVGAKGSLGVLPYAAMPYYGSQWRSTGLELGIKGLWSVDFNDEVSLGGNLGVIFEGVAPREAYFEPTYLASLSLGISLFGRFGTFLETYSLLNNNLDVIAVADGGFTFLVTEHLQLDVHAGLGLTPDAQVYDVGGGVVFLI